jgi:hypothetical protein
MKVSFHWEPELANASVFKLYDRWQVRGHCRALWAAIWVLVTVKIILVPQREVAPDLVLHSAGLWQLKAGEALNAVVQVSISVAWYCSPPRIEHMHLLLPGCRATSSTPRRCRNVGSQPTCAALPPWP